MGILFSLLFPYSFSVLVKRGWKVNGREKVSEGIRGKQGNSRSREETRNSGPGDILSHFQTVTRIHPSELGLKVRKDSLFH
jgi:hypothetical protein